MRLYFIIFLLCLILLVHSDITTNLVGFYQFNGNANDSSGNSIHGNNFGVTETTDRFGNASSAYYFDGNNDYITIADNDLYDFGENVSFTISLWVKTTQTDYSRLLQKRNYSGNFYSINKHSSGCPGVAMSNNHPEHYVTGSSSIAINDDNWHLVTLVRDVTESNIKFYVNKEHEILFTNHNYATSNGAIINIGRYFNGTIDYFEGRLDDIRFYRRALSDSDIEELYHEHSWDFVSTDLTAYYPFSGNADDVSGNGFDGMNNGASLTNDRLGSPNSAYYFDGNTDFIDIGDNLDADDHDLSICAWIKSNNFDQYGKIINKGQTVNGTPQHSGFSLRIVNSQWGTTPSGQPELRFGFTDDNSNGAFAALPVQNLDVNKFNYVVGTLERNSYRTIEMKLYVDSVPVDTTIINIGSSNTNIPLAFGALHRGTFGDTGEYFTGVIDDIRIYQRAISQNEIDQLYHQYDWMETPEATIEESNSTITITWNSIVGASSYSVFSSLDPYEDKNNWVLEESSIIETSWSEQVSDIKKFYYIKAAK